MFLSDFDYHLPEELIAQTPLAHRSDSRLLHVNKQSTTFQDRKFKDFTGLLLPDDLVVFNDSRVIPARLFGTRSGENAQPISERNPAAKEFLKGSVEILLTRQLSDWEWEVLARPGRKLGVGERVFFSTSPLSASPFSAHPSSRNPDRPELVAEIIARGEFGERTIRFEPVPDFYSVLERLGHMPLPPYIHRGDQAEDRERYQTIYSRERGSVAAPTAGLHFTPEVLESLRQRQIETTYVTLHVGLGTFQPLRAPKLEGHKLHRERYSISTGSAEQINRALLARRRIVAIGTTTTRALEYAASLSEDSSVPAGSGDTDIFLYPGHAFKVVRALLTNFHLPQSTLLMLVSALAGRELVLCAYAHAVSEGYRFYSYGDCMFLE